MMCMLDDSDPADIYQATDRTARKEHDCSECGRTIKPGETYQHVSALGDGQWWTVKTCAHCCQLWRWFSVVCGGSLHTALGLDLKEHWDEYRELALGRLLILMRRRWEDVTPAQVGRIVEQSFEFQRYRRGEAA